MFCSSGKKLYALSEIINYWVFLYLTDNVLVLKLRNFNGSKVVYTSHNKESPWVVLICSADSKWEWVKKKRLADSHLTICNGKGIELWTKYHWVEKWPSLYEYSIQRIVAWVDMFWLLTVKCKLYYSKLSNLFLPFNYRF